MNPIRRSARVRGFLSLRIGLILLLLLGAPVNLAMPVTMPDSAMPAAAMAGGQAQNCPDPGSSNGDHGAPRDHSTLCLFCTAFGGPSLASASVEPAPEISSASFATLSFDLAETALPGGHPARTQYCRGPPTAV
jgi:hypothetical protein